MVAALTLGATAGEVWGDPTGDATDTTGEEAAASDDMLLKGEEGV